MVSFDATLMQTKSVSFENKEKVQAVLILIIPGYFQAIYPGLGGGRNHHPKYEAPNF